jgi:serine protease Do
LGESDRLRLFFVSIGDTTLIVRAPDGSLLCSDDDGLLLNGAVEITSPEPGEYDVWVGSYYPDEQVAGYLMLTHSEIALEQIAEAVAVGGIPPTPAPPEAAEGGIVFDGEPEFGQTALTTGFQPDPLIITVEAGGTIDTAALDLGIGCVGFTGAEPDFRLEWSGDSSQLRLFVMADTDTTLIVRAPNGAFRCNDDFPGSRNPLVEFARPDDGTYSVWIGSFREGETGVGALYTTEFSTLNPLSFEAEK